jgi:hypothetical protein
MRAGVSRSRRSTAAAYVFKVNSASVRPICAAGRSAG